MDLPLELFLLKTRVQEGHILDLLDLIRGEIFSGLLYMSLGIEGGYRGFYAQHTLPLTPKIVQDRETTRRDLKVAMAGIPKIIDNAFRTRPVYGMSYDEPTRCFGKQATPRRWFVDIPKDKGTLSKKVKDGYKSEIYSAIHGNMAGYTGFTVGLVNGRHDYIPTNSCGVHSHCLGA
ncbi:hypothetical protein EZV62_027843 [Acer yangbiense]|uniref:Uncharacterized protein n=1 Tax=Acer yangbiense TaxID=1000413 RepID=A0A5C7GQ40_9ROSI|nr:hypothetical protein EZV62_027843 [Acer yangbiense]